jgi:hypothetical protein
MAKFAFKSSQTIGATSAELDQYYLTQCFVDTGALDILRNCSDHRRLLIARTGAGKSALLSHLAEVETHVIKVQPEELSLSYISNSNVLRFFSGIGVNLDAFYKLLWKHVLVVEILKEKYQITSEEKKNNFLESLWRFVTKSKKNERAIAYLREWGEEFWERTEYRVKEITTKLERNLSASLDTKIPGIASLPIGSFNFSGAHGLTDEQKGEIVHRAQEIVSGVQIRELSDVIDFLGEILQEKHNEKYFVTIDNLDDDWIEEGIRFRLIRALIETSLELARIQNLKVIVAIRTDLLDRVFRYARHPDFQEEKIRTCGLDIVWTKQQLTEVLDRRIDLLVKDQYTKQVVTHTDLLPARKIGKQKSIDYMLERTLLRPRDIIEFFNACIKQSNGKVTITVTALHEAEGIYSRERLRALADEWHGVYPYLLELTPILRNKGWHFGLEDLPLNELTDTALNTVLTGMTEKGIDANLMHNVTEGIISSEEFRKDVILIFYKVGIVGLRLNKLSGISWSQANGVSVSKAEVNLDTRIHVHKIFWRVFGVADSESDDIEGEQ